MHAWMASREVRSGEWKQEMVNCNEEKVGRKEMSKWLSLLTAKMAVEGRGNWVVKEKQIHIIFFLLSLQNYFVLSYVLLFFLLES